MHRTIQLLIAITLLLQFRAPVYAQQPSQDQSGPANAAVSNYPDTPAGLKSLLDDVFVAVKSNDSAKYISCFEAMAIPNADTWFTQVFGPTEGSRLDEQYRALQPQAADTLKKAFDYALKDGRTNAEVKVYRKDGEQTVGIFHAALEAMAAPGQIYFADGADPNNKFPAMIGNFVYVDGGFRYLDTRVLQALSTAPPMRIRMGGNVMLAKLTNKIEPIYPAAAVAAQVRGTVRLRVIVGTDGTVRSTTIVSGDPLLQMAAVDAVRQWRYAPTLLNGKAVEVESVIDIQFK